MKKAFNLVACIFLIVLMSVMLLGWFMLIGLDELWILTDFASTLSPGFIVLFTVGILIYCVGAIIIAALAIAKESHKCGLGLKITVIVFISIMMILQFIGGGLVYGILCLIPIGFEIASLCVKNTKPNTQTYDKKIEELKHLKELGAISEEQYNEAMKSLFENAK